MIARACGISFSHSLDCTALACPPMALSGRGAMSGASPLSAVESWRRGCHRPSQTRPASRGSLWPLQLACVAFQRLAPFHPLGIEVVTRGRRGGQSLFSTSALFGHRPPAAIAAQKATAIVVLPVLEEPARRCTLPRASQPSQVWAYRL